MLAQPIAAAAPLPHAETYELGRPVRALPLRLEAGESQLALTLAGKRRELPVRGAREVTIEIVKPAADAAVAVLRVEAEDGPWLGIVGGRSGSELLLFERAAAQGDPGERRSLDLVASGSPPALRVGVRREGVSLCAGRPYLFEARQLDPETLRLTPRGDAIGMDPSEATVAAVAVVEPGLAPRLAGLTAVSSSELDAATRLPEAPRALIDGDLERGFALEPGDAALLRWESELLPIERLTLTAGPSAKPVELLWLHDGAQPLRATLPPHRTATTFEIVPPNPIAGRCLALARTDREGAPLEIRELRAYSELDRGDAGLERLIGLLVQDGADGAQAAELLAKLGPAAAERLVARFQELPVRGQRRGLKVLGQALTQQPVKEQVMALARGPDVALSEAAMSLLAESGEPGRLALRELVLDATPTGDRAALALAEDPRELPALLAALAEPGGAARPALRAAIASTARRDPRRFHEASVAWRAEGPPLAALAGLAQAIAEVDGEHADALVAFHAPSAERFEERYRFAMAAGTAATDTAARTEAWLTHEALNASEWMQRRAALKALVQRGSAGLPAVATTLASDAYPRVRAESLAALAAYGHSGPALGALKRDDWPLVRAAAARALGDAAGSRAALEGALADRSARVRQAAIEALQKRPQTSSWSRIAERLRAEGEALPVREAAVRYAHQRCVDEAHDVLLLTARQMLSPEAGEDETELAVAALRALHALGGAAREAGAEVVREAGTPELERLWERLPSGACEVRHQS